MFEENPIFEILEDLGNTRRIDGEFCWKNKDYKYTGYTIVPRSGKPIIRIDIQEKQ